MAKLALINKQKRREKLVAQYAKKRETIKAKMSVNATPEERIDAMKKLAKLPRNANPTRLRNRCSNHISYGPFVQCRFRIAP